MAARKDHREPACRPNSLLGGFHATTPAARYGVGGVARRARRDVATSSRSVAVSPRARVDRDAKRDRDGPRRSDRQPRVLADRGLYADYPVSNYGTG